MDAQDLTRTPSDSLARQGRAIARLGAPLIAFFMVQNVISLVTLAILGQLGNATLAGIGAAGALYGVVLALLYGVDTGVQAIIARATGAGRGGRLGEVVTDAVAGSTIFGAALAAVFWSASPGLLRLMLPDAHAAAIAGVYAQASAPSLLCLAFTIPINACWIGSGRPGLSFLVSVLLAPVQIALTVLLVHGAGPIPPLNATGAAMAMSLSTLVGVGLQLLLALRLRPIPGFLRAAPSPAGVFAIATIGWPVSAQQSLLQFGLMGAFVIVAYLGVAQGAVINVLTSLTMVPIQGLTGLGVAAATLVGQALGQGDRAEARRWGWRIAGLGAAATAPLGLVALLTPQTLLGVFLHDPATVALALWPMRWVGLGVSIDAVARVIGYALRGAGATKAAAGVPFASQWLLELPLMWWIGVHLGYGVAGIALLRTVIVTLEAAILVWIWSGASWTRVRIGERQTPAAAPSLSDVSTASP